MDTSEQKVPVSQVRRKIQRPVELDDRLAVALLLKQSAGPIQIERRQLLLIALCGLG